MATTTTSTQLENENNNESDTKGYHEYIISGRQDIKRIIELYKKEKGRNQGIYEETLKKGLLKNAEEHIIHYISQDENLMQEFVLPLIKETRDVLDGEELVKFNRKLINLIKKDLFIAYEDIIAPAVEEGYQLKLTDF